jgi:hypothetical protein
MVFFGSSVYLDSMHFIIAVGLKDQREGWRHERARTVEIPTMQVRAWIAAMSQSK